MINLFFPLSAAQRGMWFAQEVNPDSHGKVFKAPEFLEIFGIVDISIFEVAIRKTIKETDAFQLIFKYSVQGPRQYFDFHLIGNFRSSTFVQSLTRWRLQNNGCEQTWRSRLICNKVRCSCALLQLAAEHFVYCASGHHLVMDGFGGSIFSRRIADIYSALVSGSEPPECPFVRLSDVLELDRAYEDSKHYQRDRQYWIEQLENCPAPVSLAEQQAACSDVLRQQMYLPYRPMSNYVNWPISINIHCLSF
ncbi:condensation domain-containing protein [Vibrio sp. PP-XX7]